MSFHKDPDALLDYEIDWTPWLDTGETITGYTVEASTGLTVDSHSRTDGIITVWLSGGTARQTYRVGCRITTSAGRIDDRSFSVNVRDR